MMKTLLKKQLMEINQFYFRDRKTGKRKSRRSMIFSIALFALLFLCLAFTFFTVSTGLGSAFLTSEGTGDLEWLYFSLMGILAFILAVVGSAFQTYSSLYQAKDNELLLSMPVKPINILFSRLVGVVLTGLLYSGLVWLPAILYYGLVKKDFTFLFPLLQFPAVIAFGTTVTCLLGWLIALVASRLKNKSWATVLASIAFFAIYMLVVNRFTDIVQRIIAQSGQVAQTVKTWLFPFYLLGIGSKGSIVGILGFWGISFGLLALCIFIMSRSFTRIVTVHQGQQTVRRRAGKNRQLSPNVALLRREWRRFCSSATYMLNTGLGLLFTVLLGVIAIIKHKELFGLVTVAKLMLPEYIDLLPVLLFVILVFLLSTNAVSAPSISLEGKTLPLIRSLPVSTRSIFNAKKGLHIGLNLPVAAICLILVSIALRLPFYAPLALIVVIGLYLWFFADLGLILNLKHVNLNWTNEAVPVKQSISVMLCLFGGWVIAIAIGVGAFFARDLFSGWVYLLLISVLLGIVILLEEKWLAGKGARLFESL